MMRGKSMFEKNIKNSFTKLLMMFCMITSSCDIFLVLTVGGSTIRWGQIAMMVLAAMAFFDVVKERKMNLPCGYGFLLGFVLLNTVFLYNCPSLRNGIGYDLWLVLDVAMIYVAAHFSDKAFSLDELLKWYILSFVCVAAFGILQKLLQFGHVYILVTQKSRVNGFCFEPSYYATYMLAGWTVLAYLLEKRNEHLFSRRKTVIYFALCSMAIVLSTSKIGWAAMLMWAAFRFLVVYGRRFLRMGRKKSLICMLIAAPLAFFALYGVLWVLNEKTKLVQVYLSGSGLFGTSAHSSLERWTRIGWMWKCIKEAHFWEGTSLGGIDPVLCVQQGIPYSSDLNGKAINVSLEIWMATGVAGLLLFLVFLFYISCWFPYRKCGEGREKELLLAFVWGLAVQFAVLQINQNILRVYFWFSIAIVMAIESRIHHGGKHMDSHAGTASGPMRARCGK